MQLPTECSGIAHPRSHASRLCAAHTYCNCCIELVSISGLFARQRGATIPWHRQLHLINCVRATSTPMSTCLQHHDTPGCCGAAAVLFCRVMVVGLFLWSAATALTGVPCFATGAPATTAAAAAAAAGWVLPLLLVSRGLMGLASAAAMPCVTATSAQLVPAAERASAVAGAYSAFNIGELPGPRGFGFWEDPSHCVVFACRWYVGPSSRFPFGPSNL